jgi:hypothetical protein
MIGLWDLEMHDKTSDTVLKGRYRELPKAVTVLAALG